MSGMTFREFPPYHQVALGIHPHLEFVSKFGKNDDIDTGSVPEDVWDGQGTYTGFSVAAQTVDVVSDSAADTAAGTGARTVQLEGLDANYETITETVTLNGVTPVTTVQEFLRCFRAFVLTAGSGQENAGTLSISQSTSGDLMATVDALHGQTAIAAYTVPAGKTGLLIFTHILVTLTTGGSAAAEVDFRIRPEGGAWRAIENNFVSSNSPLVFNHAFPFVLEEKTDIVVRVHAVSANNVSCAATFDILLIPDSVLSGFIG